MLFADGGNDSGADPGFYAAIGALIVSVATGIGAIWAGFRKDKREERKDTISEWKDLTAKMGQDYADLKKEFHDKMNEANKSILDLYARNATCEAEKARLETKVTNLQEDNVEMRLVVTRQDETIEKLRQDVAVLQGNQRGLKP